MSWLAQQTAALDAARDAAGLAANWLIQSTLLIAAGLAIGRLLQNRGAAVQSAVYRTTLAAVAVCPLATLALHSLGFSGWSVELPAAYEVAAQADGAAASPQSPAQPLPAGGASPPAVSATADPFANAQSGAADAAAGLPPAGPGAMAVPAELDFRQLGPNAEPSPDAPPRSQRPGASAAAPAAVEVRRFGVWVMAAGCVWALAATVLLARLLVAWRRLERIRRDASPAAAATIDVCRDLSRRFDIAPPAVLHSAYLPSPCLAGIRRPAIMLPDDDLQQPALAVRDVLVHELAHLRRRDCHWNLLRRTTTAVLWFQPLLWLLARRLEASAEEVCDDYVVQLGGDRRGYARRLVDIAELSATPLAIASVAMVSIRTMLEHRVRRVMDTSRSLSTRIGNLLLALLLVGGVLSTLAAGLVGLNEKASATSEENGSPTSTEPQDPGRDEASPSAAAEQGSVAGQAVDDRGRPLSGATVYAWRVITVPTAIGLNDRAVRLIAQTTTDGAGRFQLRFDASDPETDQHMTGWLIAARAAGRGPAWLAAGELRDMADVTLQLPVDEPVRGRIVDLEGSPLAGVRVRVHWVWQPTSEQKVDPWIEQMKADPPPANDRDLWFGNDHPPFPCDWKAGGLDAASAGFAEPVVSDGDGRFELAGLGANRLVVLEIDGEHIATSRLSVVTCETAPFQARPVDVAGTRSSTHFGRQFEYVAEPTQPVEGQVRDAATGAPIPRLEIRLKRYADRQMSHTGFLSAVTDDEGRYRLAGLPSGGGHVIEAAPAVDQPYFHTEHELPRVAADASSIEGDLELRAGAWLTGRVEDQEGQPLAHAAVEYLPLRTNSHAPEYQNYDPKITGSIPSNRFHTDARGRFRVLAIPGPGVVAAIVDDNEQEQFASLQPGDLPDRLRSEGGYLNAFHPWTVTGYYALQEIELAADVPPAEVLLQCRRGATRQVTFVDASGLPVDGVRILGRKFPPQFEQPLEGSEATLVGLRPDEQRILIAVHEQRRIGQALEVAAAGDRLNVELLPCAVVRGRIVDEDGSPLPRADVSVRFEGPDNWMRSLGDVDADSDGRFELLVPPGLPAYMSHYSEDMNLRAACQPAPGDVIELGDLADGAELTVEQTAAMTTAAAAAAQPGEQPQDRTDPVEPNAEAECAGSVVTPDGQPAAEADLYLVYYIPEPTGLLTPTLKPVAQTDAAGRFRFKLASSSAQYASLVAVKEGYGFAWSEAGLHETSGRLLNELKSRTAGAPGSLGEQFAAMLKRAGQPLQLVADDQPLRGRIVDINGQPVAGARLTLREVSASVEGDLAAWRAAATADKADYYSARLATPRMMNGPQVRSLVQPATTDADGRFTLRGVGQGRIAELLVEGPGIETARVLARTEPGEAIELERERRMPHGKYVYHPAEFTHVAGPSASIAGVVRDAKTGAPLKGVTVKSQSRHGEEISGWGQDFVRAVTDAEGRYQLHGMPVGDDNRIAAIAPADEPYLSMSHEAPTSADRDTPAIDFELQRGVWVEGRVTDRQSGEGLAGMLEYYVPAANPHYRLTRHMNVDERDRLQADREGRFRIACLPGPGFIAFQAEDHERYPRAVAITLADGTQAPADEYLKTGPSYLMPANYHVVAEINPDESAPRHELNLQLDRGGTVTGRVVDAQGQPVADFFFSGQIARFDSWRPGKNDSFEVTGVEAAAPRDLYFFHRERNLAAHLKVTLAEPQPPVVALQPAGTVKGRLVDASGEPLANYVLHRWSSSITSPGELNNIRRAPPLPPSNDHTQVGEHETNADGRFEIAGLVPGVEYRISAFDRQSMQPSPARAPRPSGAIDRAIIIEPGQTLDLGDVTLAEREAPSQPQSKSKEATAVATETAASDAASPPQEPSPQGASLRVHGQVRAPSGEPLAGVAVAVISLPIAVQRGGDLKPRGETLFETVTGEDGRYSLELQGLSAATHRNTSLIARAEGLALAWRRLDVGGAEIEASFDLQPEQPLTVQFVDIEGRPAAGVRVNVAAVMPAMVDNRPPTDGVGYQDAQHAPKAWFPPMTADDQGRISLLNVAAGHAVFLVAEGDDRFAPQDIAVNTGMPEQRGERDATYRSQVVNQVKPGDVRSIPLSPAQPFTGVVRYEDTGEPAPHARLTIWASQQQFGSMMSVAGVADAEGRYRLSPRPGIRFGVTAYPPDGAPYLGRQAEPVRWDAGDQSKQVDIMLPRGVLVRGRVVEEDSETAIAGAAVQFIAERSQAAAVPEGVLTGWQDLQLSDGEGRFTIVVPAGPGRLVVHGPSNDYVIVETSSRELDEGRPGGERNYAHAIQRIESAPGAAPLAVTIRLQRGESAAGELVDPDGRPIASALMITPLAIHATSLTWRAHASPAVTGGRFSLSGLAPGKEHQVLFLDQQQKLGAVATLTGSREDHRVFLQPCGRATMRFVDPAGQPARNISPAVQLVVTPGPFQFDAKARDRGDVAADADFIANVDRRNHSGNDLTDDDGRLEIDALIPGATYRVVHGSNGEKLQTTDFVPQSGATVDIGEFTLDLGSN